MLRAWDRRGGERLQLFRAPMDLRHLGAVGEWLAVPGHAGPVSLDHHGIREDRSKQGSVLTDGDHLPGLVSPELGEREPTRHFQGVLVLGGQGAAAQGTGEHGNASNRPYTLAFHSQSLPCQALEVKPAVEDRSQGKRQMSSTPLVAWAFEFPSGSAIFPSITIGLFQCPPPHARSASCTPVSDRYTRSPPPFGSYTKRSVSAMTGLVPAF